MCLDLDLENYTKLYTSKFFNKKKSMDEKQKRLLLDEVINGLGQKHDVANSSEWDLKMVDVDRNYDLLLGFASLQTPEDINKEGSIIIETQT